MNNPKIDLQLVWSPFRDDEFILNGNSIQFYKITGFDASNRNRIDSNLLLSDKTYAKLIGSINSYQSPKLVAWYPFEIGYHIIALHESNQDKIKLLSVSSFNPSENLADNGINILQMDQPRISNQLKWNPIWQSNLLGVACEHQAEKSSIYIYDVFRPNNGYGLNEYSTCYSLCWHPENANILFTGVADQNISLFDLRNRISAVESVRTEYVREFSIDNKNCYRAVSYENNKIAVWDLRKFSKPVGIMEESKPIKQIQVCPARADRLGVLTENSTQVSIYRIEEKHDLLYRETVQYDKNDSLSKIPVLINSFCWHSKDYNRLMVSHTFKLMDLIVADYCPIGFSMNDNLNVCMNDKILRLENVCSSENDMNIGEKMKTRAMKNYGVQNFLANLDLISNDSCEADLKYFWTWLDLSSRVHAKEIPYARYDSSEKLERFIGIKTILTNNKNILDQMTQQQHASDGIPYVTDVNKRYIYEICGWNNWEDLVLRLEAAKEFERAACLCVFNKDLRRGLEILNNASKSSELNEYLALSLALSLISKTNHSIFDNKDSMGILGKLNNPYLKILFQYVIDPENFDQQIIDNQILILDRICIALNVFRLDQLILFINKLTSDCIKFGNLFGILLTGLNNIDCIDLFRNYLNRTSDVQTPAVAIINSSKFREIVDNRQISKYVTGWIESYRELLDSWMLWEQRCQYDIRSQRRDKIVEPKVHIKCNFCGNNISTLSSHSTRRQKTSQDSTAIGMSCQWCSKQSLRCTVCWLLMNIDPPRSSVVGHPDKMKNWFVFCQKCCHGGHLGHLKAWFKTNRECPLMTCECKCYIPEGIFDECLTEN